jgi:hypothetical protein
MIDAGGHDLRAILRLGQNERPLQNLPACAAIIPLSAAVGFVHMTSEISALGRAPAASTNGLPRATLGTWQANLVPEIRLSLQNIPPNRQRSVLSVTVKSFAA